MSPVLTVAAILVLLMAVATCLGTVAVHPLQTETFAEQEKRDPDYRARMIALDQIDRLNLTSEQSKLKGPLLDGILEDAAFRDKLVDTVAIKKDDRAALSMVRERFEQQQSTSSSTLGKRDQAVQLLKRALKLLEQDKGEPASAAPDPKPEEKTVAKQPSPTPTPVVAPAVEGFENHVRTYHAYRQA